MKEDVLEQIVDDYVKFRGYFTIHNRQVSRFGFLPVMRTYVRDESRVSISPLTWAAGAKALGDPTRLAIAVALAEADDACVCDLAWIVGRDEKLVSHHLRLLRTAGLASSTRQGKMVMYELTERGRALLSAVQASEPVTE